jgi:hypothetical protein
MGPIVALRHVVKRYTRGKQVVEVLRGLKIRSAA